MTIIIEPPAPEDVPELKALLEHKDDTDFVTLLEESLNAANSIAQKPVSEGGLEPALYAALPLDGMDGWPTTFDAYVFYLIVYSRWIPQQSTDAAWLADESKPLGEHQEVYDRLCWFYWLIDQKLDGLDGGVLQDIPWFADFLVLWAKVWGAFLDTDESFDNDILGSFVVDSPKYRIQDSMISNDRNATWPPQGSEWPEAYSAFRPNLASGWKTFNQFFARELNQGLRPISDLADNTTVTVPADCTYKEQFEIDANGTIQPPIVIKGTHTYATVQQLLEGSQYADAFNGGHFIHLFLGPYSYHRFHTPVAGVVKECYPLTGQVYLAVSVGRDSPDQPYDGQFHAADSAKDGYQFLQARGVLTVDTSGSQYGNVGVVAVLPIGMCQVSGVNMTHQEGAACDKGDEFGYFTFGGSDIIILTQAGTDPTWNPLFTPNTHHYSQYGTLLGNVKKLG